MTTPHWTWAAPVFASAIAALARVMDGPLPGWLLLIAVACLFAAVFAAVRHAEVVAHRLGDPLGAIILALAVTVIEVSLIVSVLIGSADGDSSIARDTVFAAIIITTNGIIGLCLLIGGARYTEQGFQARGASSALAVLGTVAVLGLVLPNYTLAVPGPVYAPFQLLFVAVVSLLLYGVFLFMQTVQTPEHFRDAQATETQERPDARTFRGAMILLPLTLMAVVFLAESLTPVVEGVIASAGLPEAMVGVIIAMVVLMPEGTAAVRAAQANRIQTSLNLALGSALASICLTIPTVAMVSLWWGQPLILGLEAEHIVLLMLSLFMATLTLAAGRTTVLQGAINLVIFGAFLTIAAMP